MEDLGTSAPRRETRGDRARVTVDVSGLDPLWFEVDAVFDPLLSERSDHVAISLLMPAMQAGRALHVGGVVTDVLLHQLNHDLQSLLRSVRPGLNRVTVSADDVAPPAAPASGVSTGFSGGVDSLTAIRTYMLDDDVPTALRVTHLTNHNVGSHGTGGEALWRARCEPLAAAAADWGVPFVGVNSNLDAHYPRIGFLQSVSIRNAAVPHLLGAGIGRAHHASAQPFERVEVGGHGDIALVDTMLLPLLSTPAVTLSSANSGTSRMDKTIALIGRTEARYLDVCIDMRTNDRRNCGRCGKCLRTMLTLEIAGELDTFIPQVFPLGPYLEHRDAFIAQVLGRDDPFAQDIRALAAARGWRFGSRAYGRAATVRVADVATGAATHLRRRAGATAAGRLAKRMLRR